MKKSKKQLFTKFISAAVSILCLLNGFCGFYVKGEDASGMSNSYYFFNPRIIDSSVDSSLVLSETEKSVTDAHWLDQYSWTAASGIPDWEQRVTILYPYVLYDENGISVDGTSSARYKMWYHSRKSGSPTAGYSWTKFIIDKDNSMNVSFDGENKAKGKVYGGSHVLCYMESDDGITWTRPDCGEYFYKTQSGEVIGTNILFIGSHGHGVIKNENPDPNEPAFLLALQPSDRKESGVEGGVALSWSDNGIHREESVDIKTSDEGGGFLKADTHNQVFWSPEKNAYVVISRDFANLRAVARMESIGLSSIRDLGEIKESGGEYWKETSKYFTDPENVLTGTQGAQPYSMPVTRLCDGYYIGIVSVADFADDSDGVYQSVHAELAWSPDSENWYYINGGQAFIPNAAGFEFEKGNDYGMIYSAAPVNVGGSTKIFYAATPELHYTAYSRIPENIKAVIDSEIPKAAKAQAITRTTAHNAASFGRDRYAGYYSENGSVLTTEFEISGESLNITADVNEGGSIKLALVDENGEVIDGYGYDDFTPVTESVTDGSVSWGEKRFRKTVSQRFQYSFQML